MTFSFTRNNLPFIQFREMEEPGEESDGYNSRLNTVFNKEFQDGENITVRTPVNKQPLITKSAIEYHKRHSDHSKNDGKHSRAEQLNSTYNLTYPLGVIFYENDTLNDFNANSDASYIDFVNFA